MLNITWKFAEYENKKMVAEVKASSTEGKRIHVIQLLSGFIFQLPTSSLHLTAKNRLLLSIDR